MMRLVGCGVLLVLCGVSLLVAFVLGIITLVAKLSGLVQVPGYAGTMLAISPVCPPAS